ncbi:MAG: DEDD exonuclease domain-containing protein [Nocardiaceae bacterium]|nr:DEDD exonuclease domain-containing protein [Nocardiaceae bacterium]
MTVAAAAQLSFDQLDTPLCDTTFVVVDLETTGGSAAADAITEIGAVKVRGGQVIGELGTLVNPGRAIPPQIVEITGITSAMVVDAPRINTVLPSFFEFARGSVLVAHNARFDIGFLKAAAAELGIPWPGFTTLCTVKLARRVLRKDEAPSVRLSAMAQLFNASTTPTHRALDDARATVDVLHGLFERLGNQGVHSYTELIDYLPDVSPGQRAKRGLAAGLPRTPGVYLFRGPGNEVLYVGTAVNLQRRVRNYFTGSESRGRMKEMITLAEKVDHVQCAHGLEAGVRELRLLAAHAPPYNRRSKFPKRAWWLSLTDEPFPRFTIRRTADDRALGPFRTRTEANDTALTLADVCGIRTCTDRLRAHDTHGSKCPPAVVGGCPASRVAASLGAGEYAQRVELVDGLITGYADAPVTDLYAQIEELSAMQRFETAARLRDRTALVIDAVRRRQRLASLARIDELVAARPDGNGGWELAIVRCGRLAAAGNARRGVAPMPVVDLLTAGAETPEVSPGPLRGALAEETALILRWLTEDGVRIVRTSDGYAEPVRCAARWQNWSATARRARHLAGI